MATKSASINRLAKIFKLQPNISHNLAFKLEEYDNSFILSNNNLVDMLDLQLHKAQVTTTSNDIKTMQVNPAQDGIKII